MKALLLDVGNTRLKWGLYDGRKIDSTGSVSRAAIGEQGAAALTDRLPQELDSAMAANVGGREFGDWLASVLESHRGLGLRFARVERAGCGITNSYARPERMGVDRWAAMVGAWAEQSSAALVVDAGTAVTIDALDDTGQHLGGQIIPGLTLMAESLAAGTSDIPLAGRQSRTPKGGLGIFGNTTASAVRLGSLAAVCGAIERALDTMREHDLAPALFLTGGDASRILDALDEPVLHRPHLVLAGLARMLDEHR